MWKGGGYPNTSAAWAPPGLPEVTAPSGSWQHTGGDAGAPGKGSQCMGSQVSPAWAEWPSAINHKSYKGLGHRNKHSSVVWGLFCCRFVLFCFPPLSTKDPTHSPVPLTHAI